MINNFCITKLLSRRYLFNNKKNGGKNEYANKTTIASALETFTCVLSFV